MDARQSVSNSRISKSSARKGESNTSKFVQASAEIQENEDVEKSQDETKESLKRESVFVVEKIDDTIGENQDASNPKVDPVEQSNTGRKTRRKKKIGFCIWLKLLNKAQKFVIISAVVIIAAGAIGAIVSVVLNSKRESGRGTSPPGGGGNTTTAVPDREIYEANVTVSNFAGTSVAGFTNGIFSISEFRRPTGMTRDLAGNVYVCDALNHVIRLISTNGIVSTFAGNGTAGFADGPTASAQFNEPNAILSTANGDFYVADTKNNRVRRITALGQVETLAGNGSAGYQDGPGITAMFSDPRGIALDLNGSIVVSDGGNNRIRTVSLTGEVTTLAGSGNKGYIDGVGTGAAFDSLRGIASDSNGTIYVADLFNTKVRKLVGNVVSTFAGSTYGSNDANLTVATFEHLEGVAVDSSGNVYIADTTAHKIRKATQAGQVTTVSGNKTRGNNDGSGDLARFFLPKGILVYSSRTLLIADTNNNRIRNITFG